MSLFLYVTTLIATYLMGVTPLMASSASAQWTMFLGMSWSATEVTHPCKGPTINIHFWFWFPLLNVYRLFTHVK